MRTTKQLSITLPNSMAEVLEQRVASGEYASESEVVRDGLRTLFARDEAIETWLRTEVVASKAISPADMRAHLSQVHAHHLAEHDL